MREKKYLNDCHYSSQKWVSYVVGSWTSLNKLSCLIKVEKNDRFDFKVTKNKISYLHSNTFCTEITLVYTNEGAFQQPLFWIE